MTFQKMERMKAARGFKGGDLEGGTELGEWPGSIQPRRLGPCLTEHLVPVEDGLSLLLNLQLPPLLRALHALQDRVRPGPEGGGGCRASILSWEGEQGFQTPDTEGVRGERPASPASPRALPAWVNGCGVREGSRNQGSGQAQLHPKHP